MFNESFGLKMANEASRFEKVCKSDSLEQNNSCLLKGQLGSNKDIGHFKEQKHVIISDSLKKKTEDTDNGGNSSQSSCNVSKQNRIVGTAFHKGKCNISSEDSNIGDTSHQSEKKETTVVEKEYLLDSSDAQTTSNIDEGKEKENE